MTGQLGLLDSNLGMMAHRDFDEVVPTSVQMHSTSVGSFLISVGALLSAAHTAIERVT